MKVFYVPVLDGIRACAFLLVFAAHAGLDKIVPGGLGVTIFFFLSGYLITTLMRRESVSSGTISLSNFYLRRSLRILPPMYVTFALACFVSAYLPFMRSANAIGIVSVLGFFYNYAGLILGTDVHLPGGIGVVWSLMIEEHFYLLFPPAFLFLLRRGTPRPRQALLFGLICFLVLSWRYILVFALHSSLTMTPHWTYTATDARFDSILWGCILAMLWNPVFNDGPEQLSRQAGRLALAGLVAIGMTLVIRNPQFRETARYSIQSIALIPIFYYCVARPDSAISRLLQLTPLRWIGWLSYSMYLIHDFMLQLVSASFHRGQLITASAAFTLTILYALGVRYAVELPCRGLQRRSRLKSTPMAIAPLSELVSPTD